MSDRDIELLSKNFFMYHPYMRDLCARVEADPYDRRSIVAHLNDGSCVTYDDRTRAFRDLPKDKLNMNKEEITSEFRIRLTNIMRRKNISQLELANRTGISNVMISKYMNGIVTPGFVAVDKIAKALGCSVDEFRYV